MKRFALPSIMCSLLAAASAVGDTPQGLDAMHLDVAPVLREGVRAYQASSYDRTGGNGDTGHFLQTIGNEKVLLDVKGPGCITRIWMTGIERAAWIRIYFDGETDPTVEMTFEDFFGGEIAPFLYPLVLLDDDSSGGYICYVPMEFEQGCRITSTSPGHYYNVSYERYADATNVTTFAGTQDNAAIRAAWESVGTDPKADTGTTELGATIDLMAGEEAALVDIVGPGMIQQVELWIPGMDASVTGTVWDDGRAHNGSSSFTVAIDPGNDGVRLTRRLDYGIGNQKADVYVDGALVGEWFTEGSAAGYWLDDSIDIPASFTAGKSTIDIEIDFVSADLDWNEFTYWVESLVDGNYTETDSVDVANADSESAHNYMITGQTWEGFGERPYYDPEVELVTDDGRATADWVQFDVAIDPANEGVHLTRRLDYTIADQLADVYVDGDLAGQWFTEGGAHSRWLDSTFEIPLALTEGKSSLTVRVEFVSSANDWNEFYYWIDSIVAGEPVRTDELDVRDTADETAHNYHIENQIWEGERTFEYYEPSEGGPYLDVIENVQIRFTWNGATQPAVDVPIGGFFGTNIGPSEVRALPVGVIQDRMYCWFPMPFAEHAQLDIVNNSEMDLEGFTYRVRYTPKSVAEVRGMGLFHATYNEARPCTLGEDFMILEATGAGHFVGVVQTSQGPGLGYLEGDERIHIDGSLTPALYGTGTEDFYNGGWYFNRGRFSTPTHGNPTMEGTPIATDMYRYLLSDAIPFTSSISVGIEHGGTNDTTNTDIWSVAVYYKIDEAHSAITDELDVGDTASEAAHGYTISGETWSGALTDEYDGDDDDVPVTDDGRHHAGTSEFAVAVDPYNAGVILRRRMDFNLPRQEADVYVDDAYVGPWYDAGDNPHHRFRDSEFLIPASLTQGASQLDIRIAHTSGSDWTEYYYWVQTLRPVLGIRGDMDCDGDVDFDDISPFVLALGGQAGYEAEYPACAWFNADCDEDGDVDFDDILPFVGLIGS